MSEDAEVVNIEGRMHFKDESCVELSNESSYWHTSGASKGDTFDLRIEDSN